MDLVKADSELFACIPEDLAEAFNKETPRALGKQFAALKDAPFVSGLVIRAKKDRKGIMKYRIENINSS